MEELKSKTEELVKEMESLKTYLCVQNLREVQQVIHEAQKYVEAWARLKTRTNIELSDFTYERDFHTANSCRMTLEAMESIEKEVGI